MSDDCADDDELEPFIGVIPWDEVFRQNPDYERFDVPTWERIRVHGVESAEDAQARALAIETEKWLMVAHLDPDDDENNEDS